MFNSKKFKKRLAKVWGEVAPHAHNGYGGLVVSASAKMLDRARIEEGFHVLDLGCGIGTDVFMAAERTGPTGSVVGIDIAPMAIEVALQAKETRGANNTEFQVMDVEKLDFKRDSFESVISRWTLATVPDRNRCLKEVMRVLKPGGIFSALVLGRMSACKFLTVVPLEMFRLVPDQLATVDEGGPGAFDFGPPGAAEAALNGAGFVNILAQTLTVMITVPDGETYWNLIMNGMGATRGRLAEVGPEVTDKIRRATIATVESYMGADGIRLPLETVLVRGEKPGKGRRAVKSEARVKTLDEVVRNEVDVRGITVQQLQTSLSQQGTLLVDIRNADEFSSGRLQGAVNVPRAKLEEAIAGIVDTAAHKQIVVIGTDGSFARLAAATLNDMGYQGVAVLDGGYQGWIAAGGAVDAGFSDDW